MVTNLPLRNESNETTDAALAALASPYSRDVPLDGEIYTITECVHGLPLVPRNGNLLAKRIANFGLYLYYRCVQKNGWYTFQNLGSQTFMRISGSSKLLTFKSGEARKKERFALIPNTESTYVLASPDCFGRLREVHYNKGGGFAAGSRDHEGWKFYFTRVPPGVILEVTLAEERRMLNSGLGVTRW